jgi:nucleoid-associated protein YgaU
VEIPSSEKRVRVQTGDSLWTLAAAQIGTGHAWSCIAAANPQIEDVNRIYPGQLLVIPTTCSAGA